MSTSGNRRDIGLAALRVPLKRALAMMTRAERDQFNQAVLALAKYIEDLELRAGISGGTAAPERS